MDRKARCIWSQLCLDEDVERLILRQIERSGLSAHVRGFVQREVEKPGVQERQVEGAIYSSVSALGAYTSSTNTL